MNWLISHVGLIIIVMAAVLGTVWVGRLFNDLFIKPDPFDWPAPDEPDQDICPKCQGKPVVKNGFRYCMTHSCDFIERIKP